MLGDKNRKRSLLSLFLSRVDNPGDDEQGFAFVQGEERDLFKFNAGESPAPGSTTATLEVNDRVNRGGRGQRPRRSRPMSESSEVKLREENFYDRDIEAYDQRFWATLRDSWSHFQ